MTVREVEGKKPYTGGEGISIDDKVISLNLRDENNLIIYDEGDDEIYVDLQLPDGKKPLDAFPVGITTGRVLVEDDWDKTGTIIVAKTTSGDNIKILYADDGTLWIDNGTGLFKQIYFKGDVDTIIASIQSQIDALTGLGRFLSLRDGETGEPISFPLTVPYEYHTGDWFMINVVDNTTNYRPNGSEFDGTASITVETEATEIGDVYIYDGTNWLLQKNGGGGGSAVLFSQLLGSPYDNTNLASALNAKQDTLTAGTNITIDSNTNTISATDTTYTAGTNITITGNVISATGGSDIVYATQAEYEALLPGALTDGKNYFIYTPSVVPPSPRTPGVNTIAYYPLTSTTTLTDESGNSYDLTNNNSVTFGTYQGVDCANFSGDNNNFLKQTSLSYSGGSITMSAWGYSIARSSQRNDEGFVRFGPNFGCYVGWSNRLLVCSPGGIGTVTRVSDSGRKLVTVTFDGTDMKLYVNGVLDATNQPTIPTGSGLAIGNISSSGTNANVWKGGISEVIIESTAWSAQDVSDYFNSTKANYGIS